MARRPVWSGKSPTTPSCWSVDVTCIHVTLCAALQHILEFTVNHYSESLSMQASVGLLVKTIPLVHLNLWVCTEVRMIWLALCILCIYLFPFDSKYLLSMFFEILMCIHLFDVYTRTLSLTLSLSLAVSVCLSHRHSQWETLCQHGTTSRLNNYPASSSVEEPKLPNHL